MRGGDSRLAAVLTTSADGMKRFRAAPTRRAEFRLGLAEPQSGAIGSGGRRSKMWNRSGAAVFRP